MTRALPMTSSFRLPYVKVDKTIARYCVMIPPPKFDAVITDKHVDRNLMFIGPCIIVIVEELKTNLMSLAILFHFLCALHFSNINISIIRILQLCC